MIVMLNRQIELIFKYWDGEITEEEFERCKLFSISEEVDKYASEIMENDEMPRKERELLTKEILEEFRKNKKVKVVA